jgi:predicted Zn finger-like uncharacterized protein
VDEERFPVLERRNRLIIQCPSCRTRYHYDEARFSGAPAKRIKCTKCATVFEIRNPAAGAPVEDFQPEETGPLNAPVIGADDFSLESTAMGSGPRRPRTASAQPSGASSQAPQVPQSPLTPFRPSAPKGTETSSYPTQLQQLQGSGPDASASPRRLRLPEGERISVACISGPDAGKVFPIERPRVVIGRAGADVLLTDGECSRQHAAIEIADDKAYLVDLGSTNGTYFGDRRIAQTEIDNRMEFDVGASTLMFLRTSSSD